MCSTETMQGFIVALFKRPLKTNTTANAQPLTASFLFVCLTQIF